MKKYRLFLPILLCLLLQACESDKTYDGPPQIAFIDKTATYTVNEATTTINVTVQLIAADVQPDITANIAVNAGASTCADAVNVPASVTIPSGRYTIDLPINVNYNQLADGNANRLTLDLTSSIKVAENYKSITITITKK